MNPSWDGDYLTKINRLPRQGPVGRVDGWLGCCGTWFRGLEVSRSRGLGLGPCNRRSIAPSPRDLETARPRNQVTFHPHPQPYATIPPLSMSKFYITTAIHYVNDDPHIGHMYENVVADVIARHRRRMGDDVWFLTGADEHGQKIERAAAKEGLQPIELADRVVAKHHEMWRKLNISHDDFIRTTEQRHRLGVMELIRRIQERMPDDIYLGEHTGWYCQNEETFVPENQVRDGKDESGHPVEMTTESNYFFKLSRFTEPLLAHYRANPGFIYPPTRMNEIVSFVEQGLRDL